MTDHDKPMSMVERVAKALYESWLENYSHLIEPQKTPWEELTGIHRSFGLKQARAAISAMRSPNVGMLVTTLPNVSEPSDDAKRLAAEAFSIMSPDREDRVYQAITAGSELVRDYQSMIDAALTESK